MIDTKLFIVVKVSVGLVLNPSSRNMHVIVRSRTSDLYCLYRTISKDNVFPRGIFFCLHPKIYFYILFVMPHKIIGS